MMRRQHVLQVIDVLCAARATGRASSFGVPLVERRSSSSTAIARSRRSCPSLPGPDAQEVSSEALPAQRKSEEILRRRSPRLMRGSENPREVPPGHTDVGLVRARPSSPQPSRPHRLSAVPAQEHIGVAAISLKEAAWHLAHGRIVVAEDFGPWPLRLRKAAGRRSSCCWPSRSMWRSNRSGWVRRSGASPRGSQESEGGHRRAAHRAKAGRGIGKDPRTLLASQLGPDRATISNRPLPKQRRAKVLACLMRVVWAAS
jgi:hypothetical protein